MQTISSIEKLRLLKDEVYDLRNADLKQIEDITDVLHLANDKSSNVKISMSSRDILKLMLNTHKKLLLEGTEKCFLIDQETLCKLMLEIGDYKEDVVDEAWRKLINKAETADIADMTTEQRIDALKCKLALSEEEIHSLKLQKTVILPTDDLYRTKEEYDSLRDRINKVIAERFKMIYKLSDSERQISELQMKNSVLERQLKEKEMLLEDITRSKSRK